MNEHPVVRWTEGGEAHAARWRSERGAPPPVRIVIADDGMTADAAYGVACQGTALLWRGDFQNARQMLIALASSRRPSRSQAEIPGGVLHADVAGGGVPRPSPGAVATRAHAGCPRWCRSTRTMVFRLRRAPDVRQACREAYGPPEGLSVTSLRELLGLIGAHEWRIKGIEIPAIGGRIHPHYGVFAPIRREYVDLVAAAPLPEAAASSGLAFDIGTGTGVLAAVLARRGIQHVVATDVDPRALACARENLDRLGLSAQVDVVQADFFPEGRAALVVCNPPWVPARPSSPLEHGIYDLDSRMLRGFLAALSAHLVPGGEGWLVLSDLAEHLGLRSRPELLSLFDAAGLRVVERRDVRPVHPKAADVTDALHAARAAEVTSLWRLAVR